MRLGMILGVNSTPSKVFLDNEGHLQYNLNVFYKNYKIVMKKIN